MTQETAIQHWTESAQEDWEVAQILYQNKHYAHCLFFCHLALEKLLKALFIKHKDDAPPITHSLTVLTTKTGLTLTNEQETDLKEITTFNVEARYDVDKLKLYKKATFQYAQIYLTKTKELYLWLQKQL